MQGNGDGGLSSTSNSAVDTVQKPAGGRLGKVQLLNVVIATRLMHKAFLLGDEEYWHYVDKVFQDYV